MTEEILAYSLWTLAAFAGAFLVNSFIEWGAHRFILHSNKIVSFAYELHDVSHHRMFPPEDYCAVTDSEHDKHRREHVTFVPRDYILFLAFTTPIWLTVEFLAGVPVTLGGVLATLTGLQMFNSFHWRYHVPSDTWFQRTWFFRFLSEHHRIHHANPGCNLNVNFLPIADFCLGTLRLKMPASTGPVPGSDHPVPEPHPEPIPADKEAPR